MAQESLQPLLQPVKLGSIALKHRIVMSAMTRTRNDPVNDTPRDLNVLYYEQRASDGGLIVTEGTTPTPDGKGYVREPNLYTDESIQAWRKVTSAVHSKGGFIFAQLMHAGRVSHSQLQPNGSLPVAPSAVKMAGQCHVPSGKADYEVPHALTIPEIKALVQGHKQAALNAIAAGFDGIELHGANGYLLQEFLSKKTNVRTDEYGGGIEGRAKFLLEVIDACSEAIGADRVAVKIAPGICFSDILEPEDEVKEQITYLAPQLNSRNLAYTMLASWNYEPYFRYFGLSEPHLSFDVWKEFRALGYKATLGINGGLQFEQAAKYVTEGVADVVAFGAAFVATPNLVDIVKSGELDKVNMAGANPALWYGKDPADDAKGYTDWPMVEVAA